MATTVGDYAQSVEVDFINYLNIFLMLASAALAISMPFETFVFAYAVLGPLHYLTEISWLHDRGYFTSRSKDWLGLVFGTVVATIGMLMSSASLAMLAVFAIGFTFVFSAGMVFTRSIAGRAVFTLGGVAIGMLCLFSEPFFKLFAVLLPTIIHVYIFTGVFILHGAVKGRSFSGGLSLVVFLAAPVFCLYGIATPSSYLPTEYLFNATSHFRNVGTEIISIFGLPQDNTGVNAWMRLMGFAYAYHYLNWFSKTRIIQWHKVSTTRVSLIGITYVAAVALYAFDYSIGFKVLLVLSLGHVILEFPLNFKTLGFLLTDMAKGMRLRG